jgi:hypothetical protein
VSDIREHSILTLEERLNFITRRAARDCGEAGQHDYLPKTEAEEREFKPHGWVLLAVQRAYEAGRSAGTKEIQASLRSLIGAKAW